MCKFFNTNAPFKAGAITISLCLHNGDKVLES